MRRSRKQFVLSLIVLLLFSHAVSANAQDQTLSETPASNQNETNETVDAETDEDTPEIEGSLPAKDDAEETVTEDAAVVAGQDALTNNNISVAADTSPVFLISDSRIQNQVLNLLRTGTSGSTKFTVDGIARDIGALEAITQEDLDALIYFYISGNNKALDLSGMDVLKNLEVLSIQDTADPLIASQFIMPSTLVFPELKTFAIRGSKLSGDYEFLQHSPALNYVSIAETDRSDAASAHVDLDAIKSFKNLEILIVSAMDLHVDLRFLEDFTSLTNLIVQDSGFNSGIGSIITPDLTNLKRLRQLNMTGHLEGLDLRQLNGNEDLLMLYVDGLSYADPVILPEFATLPNLTNLSLMRIGIDDASPFADLNPEKITRLDLSGNHIFDLRPMAEFLDQLAIYGSGSATAYSIRIQQQTYPEGHKVMYLDPESIQEDDLGRYFVIDTRDMFYPVTVSFGNFSHITTLLLRETIGSNIQLYSSNGEYTYKYYLSEAEESSLDGEGITIPVHHYNSYPLVPSTLYSTNVDYIYKYEQQVPARVVVNHYDHTGTLMDQEIIETYVGEPYATRSGNFEGYRLVGASENVQGIVEHEQIEVDYFYEFAVHHRRELKIFAVIDHDNRYVPLSSLVMQGEGGSMMSMPFDTVIQIADSQTLPAALYSEHGYVYKEYGAMYAVNGDQDLMLPEPFSGTEAFLNNTASHLYFYYQPLRLTEIRYVDEAGNLLASVAEDPVLSQHPLRKETRGILGAAGETLSFEPMELEGYTFQTWYLDEAAGNGDGAITVAYPDRDQTVTVVYASDADQSVPPAETVSVPPAETIPVPPAETVTAPPAEATPLPQDRSESTAEVLPVTGKNDLLLDLGGILVAAGAFIVMVTARKSQRVRVKG